MIGPRLFLVTVLVPLLGACAAAPRAEPGWQSLELSLGPQHLNEDSWAPIDGRVRGALTWSMRKPEWPAGLEFGFQYARAESKDESVASGVDFFEFRAGAAFEWRPLDWLRFVGGVGPRLGLVSADGTGTFGLENEEDSSLGFYAHAGAFAPVVGNFSIGLDGQWMDGSDYDILGESRDASATELLVALRWDF